MSVSKFVQVALEENREELNEIRKLREILKLLGEEEKPPVYTISVTSNL